MERKFQSFNEALEYYEADARSFDLKEKQPKVWRIYIERKSIIENADFMEEVQEILEASEKAIKDLKKNLLLDYNNANKLHINDGRLTGYFFYKDLCQLADDKLKQIEKPKSQPIEVKELHNHIFKGNAFEVWQSMYDSFRITESSRTDVKFMFEEMKKDGLIHGTVIQKAFLDWVSETYQIIVQKTSNHSRSYNRMDVYFKAKRLYKNEST